MGRIDSETRIGSGTWGGQNGGVGLGHGSWRCLGFDVPSSIAAHGASSLGIADQTAHRIDERIRVVRRDAHPATRF